MNDDPISQLPEPYRAAWNVLHEAGDLENILKNILENAKMIAGADWGMIVLKSDSSPYNYFLPYVRTMPDMSQGTFEERKVPLLVYLLACRTMWNKNSELIHDTSNISFQDEQEMIRNFLGDWTVKPENELNSEDENHQSLLLIPIISTNDAVGTIVLSRPIAQSPLTAKNLSEVEFFATLIGRYLHSVVMQSNLINIQSFIVSFILYETHPPLVSIRGYAELLLSDPKYGGLNDKQVDFVKGIQKYHKMLKHIIGTSYYLSRLGTDDVRVGNELCDIGEIITKGYEQLKPNLEDKKQIVNLSFEKNISAQGDEARIEYVVEALMKNACSYSPDGRDIDVSVESNEDFVRVSVSDHGIGLTDEEKRRLFQRFYRSNRAEVREYSGVGLELFIAKQYIEKMGGQIGAQGSENQGSTFWFTLPLTKD